MHADVDLVCPDVAGPQLDADGPVDLETRGPAEQGRMLGKRPARAGIGPGKADRERTLYGRIAGMPGGQGHGPGQLRILTQHWLE